MNPDKIEYFKQQAARSAITSGWWRVLAAIESVETLTLEHFTETEQQVHLEFIEQAARVVKNAITWIRE